MAAISKLNHYVSAFFSKYIDLVDPSLIDSIVETMGNLTWLWDKAEEFSKQRIVHPSQWCLAMIEQAIGNYREIQTIVEYEFQFINFLFSMAPEDIARTNFQQLLRMHDNFLTPRENPKVKIRMEDLWTLAREADNKMQAMMLLAAHLSGSKAIPDDVVRLFDSEIEGVVIKLGCAEAALDERRFKAARNNLQNALFQLDWLKKYLLFAKAHPELWDDEDTMISEFNEKYDTEAGWN